MTTLRAFKFLSCFLIAHTLPTAFAEKPQANPDVESHFTTARQAARAGRTDEAVAALTSAMKAGCCPTRALTETDLIPLHPLTPFRELIRDHANQSEIVLVPPGEPGRKMEVKATLVDDGGKPIPNALVYAYQTDYRGWYAADRGHVGGASGDQRHARLFGYLRTDDQGRFALKTIRPAGYENSDLPEHIHVEVRENGFDELITEFLFEDDPRLTPAVRESSIRAGFLVSPVVRRDGVEHASYAVTLHRR